MSETATNDSHSTVRQGRHCWRMKALLLGAIALAASASNCAVRQNVAFVHEPGTGSIADGASLLADTAPWENFCAPHHEFEAEFRGQPHRADDHVRTPIGLQHVVRYKVQAQEVTFDAGYLQRSRNPLAAFVGDDAILHSACEGTASHMSGHIVRCTELKVDGHNGCELEIEIGSGETHQRARARLVITNQRIYHAIAILTHPPDEDAAAKRFVRSLRIAMRSEEASAVVQSEPRSPIYEP